MKKKLSKTTELAPANIEGKISPDTLYPMNLMECPYCRTPIKGYTRNQRQQCGECGRGYIVMRGCKVVFALT